MAWFIVPEINNGYPYNDGFPDTFATSFIANDNVQYPYAAWRIKAGVNNGYPWKFWWFEEDTSSSGDEMDIGGSKTNYPDGFTTTDDGGISDQFNDNDMDDNDGLIEYTNTTFHNALGTKMFALISSDVQQVIHFLNDPSFWDVTLRAFISDLYGANIYDGIIACKCYPFQLQLKSPLEAVGAAIYGKFPLVDWDSEEWNAAFRCKVNAIQKFNMGSVTLDVLQAWELENVEYSIYLPFAGTFPIDVRARDTLSVKLYVDVFTGVGEYILKQNGQITNAWKVQLGYDFPLNVSEGQMSANMAGSVVNSVVPIISTAATIAGGPEAGMVANAAMGGIRSNKIQVTAPQVGGLTSVYSYPKVRIIARVPKMFRGGYGYRETQGDNRSTTYTTLDTCSGFIQCQNYKSNVITATDDEKAEIESLMNTGVFL